MLFSRYNLIAGSNRTKLYEHSKMCVVRIDTREIHLNNNRAHTCVFSVYNNDDDENRSEKNRSDTIRVQIYIVE